MPYFRSLAWSCRAFFLTLGLWLGVSAYPFPRASAEERSAGVEPAAAGLPRIGLSDTIIHIEALRLGPLPEPALFTIFNETQVGDLHWAITVDRSWLSTSPPAAVSNETEVAVWLTDTESALGLHRGRLFINSNNAVNAPETVWVEVSMLCPVAETGDVNNDGRLSQADIIYLVNNILRGGPAPVPVPEAGDVNCDQNITQADLVYLLNHILRAGPSPCNVCQFF